MYASAAIWSWSRIARCNACLRITFPRDINRKRQGTSFAPLSPGAPAQLGKPVQSCNPQITQDIGDGAFM